MNLYQSIHTYFSSWRLPATLISAFLFIIIFLGSILLIPATESTLSQFALDFKVWCFGYDPATGEMEWAYIWMFFLQPLLMVGIIVIVWYSQLKSILLQAPLKTLPYVFVSLVLVMTIAFSLPLVVGDEAETEGELPFPAERIRTALNPIPFSLINQDSNQVDLDDLSDKIIMITGIYSTCGFTCPMILAQVQNVLGELSEQERSQLAVVAITLDPENDRPHKLKRLAKVYDFQPPLFHALCGDPDEVNAVLDNYNFARTRNPETGEIDHTNLFILIDANGKIAYRFSLGKTQESWLTEAIKLLVSEIPTSHGT